MNSASLPLATPVQPPKRPRRWPRIVLLLAVIVLLPIGWYAYSHFTTRNAWAEAEAETDRLDPRWRLADMEADRKIVADAENSAPHIVAVWKTGGVIGVRGRTYDLVFKVQPQPNVQMNAPQTAHLRGTLGLLGRRLQDARRLKEMPYGRFPLKDIDDFLTTSYSPRIMNVRHIADEWLQHDAWLLAQDQEYGVALESCRACIMAGRATAEEPFLTSHLVRVVVQATAIATLERVLAQGEASEDRLRSMQALLEEEMKTDGWLRAARGERAGAHYLFENMRDGKVKPDSLGNTGLRFSSDNDPQSISAWIVKIVPSSVLHHYPEYLRFMNQYVEIVKLPIHERGPKLEAWGAQNKHSRNPLIRMTAPKFASSHNAMCLYAARLRAAVVALACERYRLKHKGWPATLDVLVKEHLLDAISTDPIDNQPLRYHRKADGIVIYSSGLDRTDNQGYFDYTIEDFNVFGPGADIGFRVWNVSHRRQAPLLPK